MISFAVFLSTLGCSGKVPSAPGDAAWSKSGTHLGEDWHVDTDGMLIWEGEPYVPYTTFAFSPFEVSSSPTGQYHFWIDTDDGNPAADPERLAEATAEVAAAGETYTVLLLTQGPMDDAWALFDADRKQEIVDSWRPFAEALDTPALRAIFLFNEINIDWAWGTEHTVDEYAQELAGYGLEAKALVGDVPVLLKLAVLPAMTEGYGNFQPAVGALDHEGIDGIGLDAYPTSCADDRMAGADAVSQAIRGSDGGGLVWMSELGAGTKGVEGSECSWDSFPPFETEEELRCDVDTYVTQGATGLVAAFTTDGPMPPPCEHLDYADNIAWFLDMEPEVVARIEE